MSRYLSAGESYGKRVINAQTGKKVGKVRNVIVHPCEKRVVGFTVKRPDVLLMAHRKDSYFTVQDSVFEDKEFSVNAFVTSSKQPLPELSDSTSAGSKELAKRSKSKKRPWNWNDGIIWYGLTVLSEDGEQVGFVGDFLFDERTGAIKEVILSESFGADVLLGKAHIKAADIKGFKRGVGGALYSGGEDEAGLGALIIANEAAQIELGDLDDGLAEKAGTAAAVVSEKASETKDKVSASVKPTLDKASEKASQVANDASTKGAYKLGEQLGKSTGMFSSFLDEYKKASK